MSMDLIELQKQYKTTSATYQINNAKLYVSVVNLLKKITLNFLKGKKQGFRKTVYWNKYKSDLKYQHNAKIIVWII